MYCLRNNFLVWVMILLAPLKVLPAAEIQSITNLPVGKYYELKEVIPALTGFAVLPWQGENATALKSALDDTLEHLQSQDLRAARVNEAGLQVEDILVECLRAQGFQAKVPRTQSGVQRAVGYPDIELQRDGLITYLEVKVYSSHTEQSSQRTFYLSPSKDPKITTDASHLLAAFTLVSDQPDRYRAVGYKLVDLYNLDCRLKYEFNASNRDLYTEGNVIMQSGE